MLSTNLLTELYAVQYAAAAFLLIVTPASPACGYRDFGRRMAQLRISRETHELLRELARQEGLSMQGVLDKALVEYQKYRFFDSLDAAFGALKADPEAWDEEQRERGLWANTLSDGIEPDEVWTEDGDVVGSR